MIGRHRRGLLVVAVLAAIVVGAASAGEPDRLDWSAWQHLPVLHEGRVKPLDTFARLAVETICGRQNPRLGLAGAIVAGDVSAAKLADLGRGIELLPEAIKLFPEGKPRQFTAAELLLSWLVEPEKWEMAPFLVAEHERLRKELFDLPLTDKEGNRLKYVSPWQVARSAKFRARLEELEKKQKQSGDEGEEFEPTGMDKKVKELYDAYNLYRLLTFNPTAPDSLSRRFMRRFQQATETWGSLEPGLLRLGQSDMDDRLKQSIVSAAESARALSNLVRQEDVTLAKVEPALVGLRQAAGNLAPQLEAHAKRLSVRAPADWTPDERKQTQMSIRALAARTAELARLANEALLALYDSGRSLAIVPALNPAALERKRGPRDDAQPWLSLQTVILGSDVVLGEYPAQALREVREAFHQVGSVYVDRSNPDRAERFDAAMDRFAAAVRALGEAIEPLREKLPIQDWDEELMAATAYPPAGFTDVEVRYNQLDPFFWSWSISLFALVCFGLSFGIMRKPMFWLGIFVLLAGQVATLAGFGLRWHITGLVPVTGMFETVVFTALCVSLLGIWFALLPLLWPGLTAAWRLTAAPLTWEAGVLSGQQAALMEPRTWSTANRILLLPRLALAAAVFIPLSLWPYGSANSPIFSLGPKTDGGASFPTWNHLLTWAVGLCVLGLTMWYVPRLALSTVLGAVMVPYTWIKQGARKALEQVMARKVFALTGAAVALLAALLAYYAPAPVMIREIKSVRPILRDNFWLLVHVLSITASYGAGALAWGLGNIALGYYLFGRYRDPAALSPALVAKGHRPAGGYVAPHEAFTRRPPEDCASLAHFVYRATQVAVLLLIAGTITGALWADVAWGRFWGWDSKEVAALISTMIYLLILHGRFAGWFGNFGLAVGSVLGATAIIGAWYGVNYFFGSGLHSYGTGAGGQLEVGLAIACNWLFMGAAAARYLYETRVPAEPRASGAL